MRGWLWLVVVVVVVDLRDVVSWHVWYHTVRMEFCCCWHTTYRRVIGPKTTCLSTVSLNKQVWGEWGEH